MGDRLRPNRGGVSQGLVQGCYAIEQFRKLGSALVRHSGQEEGEKIGNLVKRVVHLGNLVNRVVTPWPSPLHHQPLTQLPWPCLSQLQTYPLIFFWPVLPRQFRQAQNQSASC